MAFLQYESACVFGHFSWNQKTLSTVHTDEIHYYFSFFFEYFLTKGHFGFGRESSFDHLKTVNKMCSNFFKTSLAVCNSLKMLFCYSSKYCYNSLQHQAQKAINSSGIAFGYMRLKLCKRYS